jgi:hypothetical protein
MALALLRRSDTDLILPVACDAPERLAAELSALQPFSVEVVAAWAGCAGKLPLIQNALWSRLVRNSWFSVAAEEAKQLMSEACKQEEDTRPLETCNTQLRNALDSECCENELAQNVAAGACEPSRPVVACVFGGMPKSHSRQSNSNKKSFEKGFRADRSSCFAEPIQGMRAQSCDRRMPAIHCKRQGRDNEARSQNCCILNG